MQSPDNPRDNFIEVAWDAAANILYLCGVAVIELIIRPMFTNRGVPIPIIANLILTTGELLLLFTLLRKLLIKIDGLIHEAVRSWTVQSLVKRITALPNKELTDNDHSQETSPSQANTPEITESPPLVSPETRENVGDLDRFGQ